jgi:hypothetical protein
MARYAAHAPGLASRLIDGEEVVVSSRTKKVWALNPAGAFLWELADGSREVDELAALLAVARDIDRGQAGEEIEAFGADLAARGLLAWREVPGAASRRAKRIAEQPPRNLSEPPRVIVEEPLQVLAGTCDSNSAGNPGLCMQWPTCTPGFD